MPRVPSRFFHPGNILLLKPLPKTKEYFRISLHRDPNPCPKFASTQRKTFTQDIQSNNLRSRLPCVLQSLHRFFKAPDHKSSLTFPMIRLRTLSLFIEALASRVNWVQRSLSTSKPLEYARRRRRQRNRGFIGEKQTFIIAQPCTGIAYI